MNIALLNNFFGPDMLIIFLVILLLFGAKKLPELAKGMGQAVREFSKAKDEIEREVTRPPASEPPKALNEPQHDVVAEHDYHQEHQGDHPGEHPTDAPKTEAQDSSRVV